MWGGGGRKGGAGERWGVLTFFVTFVLSWELKRTDFHAREMAFGQESWSVWFQNGFVRIKLVSYELSYICLAPECLRLL